MQIKNANSDPMTYLKSNSIVSWEQKIKLDPRVGHDQTVITIISVIEKAIMRRIEETDMTPPKEMMSGELRTASELDDMYEHLFVLDLASAMWVWNRERTMYYNEVVQKNTLMASSTRLKVFDFKFINSITSEDTYTTLLPRMNSLIYPCVNTTLNVDPSGVMTFKMN